MKGTLYLVATPIGNLEDITYRAVRTLREVDVIACEDTRQTRKLLDHYSIAKRMVSYHEHNEITRAEELVAEMEAGANVALVSDAGTPLVSDPGYRLVTAGIRQGIRVVPIPGPSALVAAATGSGLATEAFHFGGFLPAKAGARVRALEAMRDETATLLFYEAPHRIVETLADVQMVLGERPVAVARELTKIHEEFVRGLASEVHTELRSRPSVKGEITLVIGRAVTTATHTTPIEDAVEAHIREGMSRMDAIKKVAHERRIPKREVYRRTQIEKS